MGRVLYGMTLNCPPGRPSLVVHIEGVEGGKGRIGLGVDNTYGLQRKYSVKVCGGVVK